MEIELQPLTPDDFPTIRDWMDPGVFPIFRDPVDDGQLGRLLTQREGGRVTSLGYRAVGQGTGPIGLIHAVIDGKNDLAHIGQIVVGEARRRGRGIGTEILRQFLPICFVELGLHRVQLFVDEGNSPARACYKKAGFVSEGLMREARKEGDSYVSWYSMSILVQEWKARQSPGGSGGPRS